MYTVINEKFVRYSVDNSGIYSTMLRVHIICDAVSDIPDPLLHWAPGSRCDVLENGGSTYELSHSGEWMKIISTSQGGGGEGGATSYTQLADKPQINGITLTGNKSTEDLNIQSSAQVDGENLNL